MKDIILKAPDGCLYPSWSVFIKHETSWSHAPFHEAVASIHVAQATIHCNSHELHYLNIKGILLIPKVVHEVSEAENDLVLIDFGDHTDAPVEDPELIGEHKTGEIEAVDVADLFKSPVSLFHSQSHVRMAADEDDVGVLLQYVVDLIGLRTEPTGHLVVLFAAESPGKTVRLVEGKVTDDKDRFVVWEGVQFPIQPRDLLLADKRPYVGAFARHDKEGIAPYVLTIILFVVLFARDARAVLEKEPERGVIIVLSVRPRRPHIVISQAKHRFGQMPLGKNLFQKLPVRLFAVIGHVAGRYESVEIFGRGNGKERFP